jgi:hypothetical protein
LRGAAAFFAGAAFLAGAAFVAAAAFFVGVVAAFVAGAAFFVGVVAAFVAGAAFFVGVVAAFAAGAAFFVGGAAAFLAGAVFLAGAAFFAVDVAFAVAPLPDTVAVAATALALVVDALDFDVVEALDFCAMVCQVPRFAGRSGRAPSGAARISAAASGLNGKTPVGSWAG